MQPYERFWLTLSHASNHYGGKIANIIKKYQQIFLLNSDFLRLRDFCTLLLSRKYPCLFIRIVYLSDKIPLVSFVRLNRSSRLLH